MACTRERPSRLLSLPLTSALCGTLPANLKQINAALSELCFQTQAGDHAPALRFLSIRNQELFSEGKRSVSEARKAASPSIRIARNSWKSGREVHATRREGLKPNPRLIKTGVPWCRFLRLIVRFNFRTPHRPKVFKTFALSFISAPCFVRQKCKIVLVELATEELPEHTHTNRITWL